MTLKDGFIVECPIEHSPVAPFLSEIGRMERNLHRVVPDARAFVRPGFDEMAEVNLLDSGLRRH